MEDGSSGTAVSRLSEAVNAWQKDPAKSVVLTREQRSQLVEYAEQRIDRPTAVLSDNARSSLGRVEALYIAATLATVDRDGARSPFKDSELTRSYERQQDYKSSLAQREQPQNQAQASLAHTARGVER